MKSHALALGVATAALLALGACNKQDTNANGAPKAQTSKAAKVAGTKTIAAGLAASGRFMADGQGRRARPDARRPRTLYGVRPR